MVQDPGSKMSGTSIHRDAPDGNMPAVTVERTSGEISVLDTDCSKTPRGEDPPLLSNAAEPGSHLSALDNEATPTSRGDYFGPARTEAAATRTNTTTTTSNISSPLHSAGASSSSLQSTGVPGIPAPSADSHELFSRLIRVQSGASAYSTGSRAPGRHSSKAYSPHPTSVSVRARPHHEGPHYPDQSFAALHHQMYTPPYPHYRAHSPFLHNGSQMSDSPNRSQEFLQMSPSVRTGGNTPVESPGLFSRRGRFAEEDMESSQYKAPSLHPIHSATPKESHLLKKDFDAMTGHKLINNYEILRELGKGTHGKVKLARAVGMNSVLEDQRVAIKIVKRFKQRSRLGGHETQEDKVKKEIAVLKKARHPHVVSLIEVIDDPDWNKVYMILEYVEEGEMKWRRKADKRVVQFERRRVQAEREAWERGESVDPALEDAQIDEFNLHYQERMHEKAQILAHQKQRAFENMSSRKSSSATTFTDDEQPRDMLHNWSLEHGGESEDEAVTRRPRRKQSHFGLLEDRFNAPDMYTQAHLARSVDVLPAFRDPFASGSDPTSPAMSNLGTPLITPVMAPPLPESVESDKAFLRELKNIQRAEDYENFTDEDEHFRHVPCLTLTRARECFRDTVLGLEYLHAQDIIHRDIKPANLLWTKEHRVKISDFGVSYLGRRIRAIDSGDAESESERRGDDDVELARTVGTPAFYAPELCDPDLFLEGRDKRRMIGPQMDIWALGVTLYCMVFARLPFAHHNQIALFERIAKQELFIPSRRLKAIRLNKRQEHGPKDRPEDLLWYEEIGDELTDLLKRLLHKDPTKRITIMEIKRHPWVVRGMTDPVAWLEETDPSKYLKDNKIHITDNDVSKAIAPLSFAERVKQLGQRMSSLVRGRDPSKRASSRAGKSASASSRSTGPDMSSRRASVRSEDVLSLFRPKQEPPAGEHPLSQSQLASPTQDETDNYFSQTSPPPTVGVTPTQQRPSQPDRGVSAAESVRTIRAPRRSNRSEFSLPGAWECEGPSDFDTSQLRMDEQPTSHPSPTAQRFGGASRSALYGLVSKRSSMSMSSKSTSSDRLSSNIGDPHTVPLVGTSSATATGLVEPPPVQLPPVHSAAPPSGGRPRAVTSPRPRAADNFDRAHFEMVRRDLNDSYRSRPHSQSAAPEFLPMSPDDEILFQGQRHDSRGDAIEPFLVTGSPSPRPSSSSSLHSASYDRDLSATSSLDDVQAEAMFSDRSRHPSMPSVISASSITSINDSLDRLPSRAVKRGADPDSTRDSLMSTGETMTPAMAKNLASLMETAKSGDEADLRSLPSKQRGARPTNVDDDEMGYNGDHDGDDDSDDEGIVFGGQHC